MKAIARSMSRGTRCHNTRRRAFAHARTATRTAKSPAAKRRQNVASSASPWLPHSAHRAALLALAATAFLTFARPAIAQAPPTLAEMRRVWAEREKKFQSFRFTIEVDQVTFKDAHAPPPGYVAGKETAQLVFPSEDTKHSFTVNVAVVDGNVRYSRSGVDVYAPRLGIADNLYESVMTDSEYRRRIARQPRFDGLEGTYPWGSRARPSPVGSGDYQHDHVRPVFAMYRAVHPRMKLLRSDDWVVAPQTVVYMERECCVVERRIPTMPGEVVKEAWCIEASGPFLPRRYELTNNGTVLHAIDVVSYSTDAAFGPVPEAFRATNSMSGRPRYSFEARVVKYELNAPIPLQEFDLPFVKGTFVEDRIDNTQYVLRADGSASRVLPEEKHLATYEQFLEPGASYSGYWYIGGIAAVALVAAAIYLRRRAA
jgi:hypothetical protein